VERNLLLSTIFDVFEIIVGIAEITVTATALWVCEYILTLEFWGLGGNYITILR
jgi:hypothetical protein